MPAVLFEHESKLLTDEFRSRNPALAGGPRKQPVVYRVQRDGGRLLSGKCHESNMTRRVLPGQGALLYRTTISPDARTCPFMASMTGVRRAAAGSRPSF